MLRLSPILNRFLPHAFAISFTFLGHVAAAETFGFGDFKHITFEKVSPTRYSEKEGVISAEVVSSSSFLLKPFPAIKQIRKIKWRWKMSGDFRVRSLDELKTKAGDDAVLRVGLIKSGNAPMVPFFAPAWIKAIQSQMKLSGTEMQYLVVGGPAAPGSAWVSPYTNSMNMRQVQSTIEADGWNLAEYTFPEPIMVVGLWIMSDGDGTQSRFVVSLKDLEVFQ